MLLYKRQSHNATVGCFAPWGTAHTYTLSKLLNELRSSANKNQLFHLWQMLKSPGWCWLRFANVGSILIKNSVNMRRSRSRTTIKFWTKLPLNNTRLVGVFFFFFFWDKMALFDTFLSLSLFISDRILFYQYFTIYSLSLYQYQTQFLPLFQYQREEGMKKISMKD